MVFGIVHAVVTSKSQSGTSEDTHGVNTREFPGESRRADKEEGRIRKRGG